MEEVIRLPLLGRGQGEHSGAREFSSRCEVNHMVPCFPWRELVKGFLGEDISEIKILGQHHILKGLALFDLLGLLGWSLQWGGCHPDVVFLPLRGYEHGIDCIPWFYSIVLHCI